MPPMHLQKITLAGVGLLGGSLGLACRQRHLACEVFGLVRRAASVGECDRLGVVTRATQDPAEAAADADLIVLCTPISQMKATLAPMLPALKAGAVVTDVGSVKGSVIQDLEPLVMAAGGHFVGSHPMAGAEKTGPAAARADLFADAICVVTPTPRSSLAAVERVEELWSAVGGRPLRLGPDVHDELVSRSSHLPHVVAAGLANYVLSPVHVEQQAWLCANGFRDTTRIASSPAEMWRDIVLANRKNLGRVLGVFIEDLQEFRHALEAEDVKTVEDYFEKARQRREAWRAHTPSSSPE
jgi:prephenate dehydrogenase